MFMIFKYFAIFFIYCFFFLLVFTIPLVLSHVSKNKKYTFVEYNLLESS